MNKTPSRSALTWLLVLAVLTASAWGLSGCKKDKPTASPKEKAGNPTVRIYALAGAAGAVEPCGCVKDMLGGVDHAAAFIAQQASKAPQSLVVGAGPMFFESPQVAEEEKQQELFKAEAMALSLKDIGLRAWAPGANDWALGASEFARLAAMSHALPLSSNLKDDQAVVTSHSVERAGLRIGLVGVGRPQAPQKALLPQVTEMEPALRAELVKLKSQDLIVALIAAPRGEALRLIEKINAEERRIHIAVLGKAYDQGENNDEPFPAEMIEGALVVQAPNHLQAVAIIDLYMRKGSSQFSDGTGLAAHEEKVHLDARIKELDHRIQRWKAPASPISPADIAAKEKELAELKAQRNRLKLAKRPDQGSYFLYDLVQIRDSLGEDEKVTARLSAYYDRVNDHNRVAFADRKPPAVSEGQASYVGVDSCTTCHSQERAVWDASRHSHAYQTLQTAHKEYNLDCVSCHVTGYERPGGSTVTHVSELQGVQCEVCHGPGSQHIDDPLNGTKIKAAPSKSLCASSCHHSPHVGADWSVDVAWPQILGEGHGR